MGSAGREAGEHLVPERQRGAVLETVARMPVNASHARSDADPGPPLALSCVKTTRKLAGSDPQEKPGTPPCEDYSAGPPASYTTD